MSKMKFNVSQGGKVIEEFTPVAGLIGGLLIGLASSLMLWSGKICGVSGIFLGIFEKSFHFSWRACFILGLLIGGLAVDCYDPKAFTMVIPQGFPMVILGGFLVGVGTGVGKGCTSGHGLCGVGRLSRRSIIATIVFTSTGMLTASLYHLFVGGQ